MTPKKSKNRLSHPQPHLQPSDYESDLPTSTSHRTNPALNLSVLRRHLPTTTAILFIAPYAVIYTFSAPTSSWEKSGIEGTLFVCAQTLHPTTNAERYSVVVLNRKGLNDFLCPLQGDADFEQGYVILRGKDEGGGEAGEKVWGIWVFEEEEGSTMGCRGVCAGVVKECAARAGV
ncbi:MAG: hypothetical protein Q9185_006170 [Variospora sp. 1 TL-2023]